MRSSDPKQTAALLDKLAEKILHDPLLLRKLSDRVYDLMQEEIRLQREWHRNYRE